MLSSRDQDPQSLRNQIIVAVVAGLILTGFGFVANKVLATFNHHSSQAAAGRPRSVNLTSATSPGSAKGNGTLTLRPPSTTASPKNTSHTYRRVTLSLLCSYCTGNQSMGNKVLHYTDSAAAGLKPAYLQSPVLEGQGTSCKSIEIAFSGNQQVQDRAATAYLRVIQQKSSVVQASAIAGTIATVTVLLDGGPVLIGASVSAGDRTKDNEVLMSITGSCYTADGRP